jgi:hypothetical protein
MNERIKSKKFINLQSFSSFHAFPHIAVIQLWIGYLKVIVTVYLKFIVFDISLKVV